MSSDGDGNVQVLSLASVIQQEQWIEFSATGARIIGSPTFEQWQGKLRDIHYIHEAIHYWIGDMLNFGERTYGEMYAQAIAETSYQLQTLMNDKWVTGRIATSRRHDALSFGHHAEVAALEPQAQDYWLQRAEAEHLTVHDLRAEIKAVRRSVLPAPEAAQIEVWADGEGVTLSALRAGDGSKRIEIVVEGAADGRKLPCDLHLVVTMAQARELALKIEAVTSKAGK